MKTLICIFLLGYWMFGAGSNENDANKLKEQTTANRRNNLQYAKAIPSQVMYLDSKGNIIKPKSEIK